MESYERRYTRELHDYGVATALAQHEPNKLDQTFKTGRAPAKGDYDRDKKWWGG